MLKIRIKPRGDVHLFPPPILQGDVKAHIEQVVKTIATIFQVPKYECSFDFHELCIALPLRVEDEQFESLISNIKSLLQQKLYTHPTLLAEDFIIEVSSLSKKAIVFHCRHEAQLNKLFNKYNKQTTVDFASDDPLDTVFRNCAAHGDSANLKIITPFVTNLDVQDTKTKKRSALHWAVAGEHIKCVKFLLKKGARLDVVDAQGLTPLDYYANNSSNELDIVLNDYMAKCFKISNQDFLGYLDIQADLEEPSKQAIINRLYLALNYICMDSEFRTEKIKYVLEHDCKIALIDDITTVQHGGADAERSAGVYICSRNTIYFEEPFFATTIATPYFVGINFSHELEHAFQSMQSKFLRANEPTTNNESRFHSGPLPFYPSTMSELEEVIDLIKKGDERLEEMFESFQQLTTGASNLTPEEMYDLEVHCLSYYPSLTDLRFGHSHFLDSVNHYPETRVFLKNFLQEACDEEGNIINLNIFLGNLRKIIDTRRLPLQIKRAVRPLLYGGKLTAIPFVCTHVLETETIVDDEPYIRFLGEHIGNGLVRLFFHMLSRYDSVNNPDSFDSLRQCVEQHAAVMGELPDVILQAIYPELYNYSKVLAEKVFAPQKAALCIQHFWARSPLKGRLERKEALYESLRELMGFKNIDMLEGLVELKQMIKNDEFDAAQAAITKMHTTLQQAQSIKSQYTEAHVYKQATQ